MKGLNINTTVTIKLAEEAEAFYTEYCMNKYHRPSIHAHNADGSMTMMLHEAMAITAAYPRIGRSPFDKGMIYFDESSIINCD